MRRLAVWEVDGGQVDGMSLTEQVGSKILHTVLRICVTH